MSKQAVHSQLVPISEEPDKAVVKIRGIYHRALKSIAARTNKTLEEILDPILEPHVANELRLLARNGGKA